MKLTGQSIGKKGPEWDGSTYYVKVIAYYPGTGTYLLRATSIVTTAETEQNNFINSADGPFTADTWVRAPLDTNVDRDYFALRNATAAPVTVHLETFVGGIGLCRGGGTDLYVEAADGTVLAFNDNASNDSGCSALDYTSTCPGARRRAPRRGRGASPASRRGGSRRAAP